MKHWTKVGVEQFWRGFAPPIAVLYMCFAFDAAMHGDRFKVGVWCLVSAMYWFSALKCHSRVMQRKSQQ